MRILVLTQFFPPEISAGGFRMADMIPLWVERGHSVTVITALPNYPTGRFHELYRGRLFVEEEFAGARVLRSWLIPGENGRSTSRFASFISFALASLITALVRGGPADVVVATSPPLTVAGTGRLVAFLKRARFVFDVRDLWPEALAALGILEGWPLRLCERLEASLYRAADAVVVVSRPFTSSIARVRDDGAESVRLIPNGVDVSRFAGTPSESREAIRDWLNVPQDASLIAYVGTFGMVHQVPSVFPALKMLEAENAYAVFVGDGAARDALIAEAGRHRLRNVRFAGLQPRERVPALYGAADIGLSVVGQSTAIDKVIACKIFEIMAAGLPVLAVGGEEIRQLVEESDSGAWVQAGDIDGFVRVFRLLASSSGERLGRAGRAYAERHFDRNQLGRRYAEMLETLSCPAPVLEESYA